MLIPLEEVLADLPVKITGVLHLGAHLGEEAEAYVAAGIDNVWWVEGNPALMGKLIAHTQPFGHQCICALLSDEDDRELEFNIANNGQSSSVLALGTHKKVSPDVHYIGAQQHRSVTVDTLAEKYRISGCNLINLDLQGYEMYVLRGAEHAVALADVIYTEINVDELYEGCVMLPELEGWLDERGFSRSRMLLAGDQKRGGRNWTGWGDAVFTRRTQP